MSATSKDLLKLASRNDPRMAAFVSEGIPAAHISKFALDVGLPKRELVGLVGAVSTIERKMKENTRLSSAESDRLARLASVVALANEMFGNSEKARKWLERPSRTLGGGETPSQSPLQMLATDAGASQVRERLYQIGYGMFA